MNRWHRAILGLTVCLAAAALSQPQGEVTIRCRDGKVYTGRIVSETAKGYLFSSTAGTRVVEFGDIADIASAHTPPPVETPPAPPPPPMPIAGESPSSPADTAAHLRRPETTKMGDESEPDEREGLHFGFGAGAMALPIPSVMAQAQAHLEFRFGRPAYRLSVNAGMLTYPSALPHFLGSVDNTFQFNVTDTYAFGVGLEIGVLLGSYNHLYAAPIAVPVIIKLGDKRQHQISLSGTMAVLSTVYYHYYEKRYVSFAGTPTVHLGYSLFL